MWRLWAIMFAILGALLVYAYFADPCIGRIRQDFAQTHPEWELVSSDPESGSPSSVRCVVSYRKSSGPELYREVWWYRNLGDGWALQEVLEYEPEEPAAPEPAPLMKGET